MLIAKLTLVAAGIAFTVGVDLAEPLHAQSDRQIDVSRSKYAAMQELRDLLADEVARAYPEKSRVSVYINLTERNYVLESISLSVDKQHRITREYTQKQATALIQRSADRLLRFNAEPGKHRLLIEYSGYFQRPGLKNIPTSDSLGLDIESKPGAQAFILPVAPKFLQPTRTLSQRRSQETWNWKSEAADPRLDLVRYLHDTGEDFEALLELLRIAGPNNETETPPRGFHTLLGQVYVVFDMRTQAIQAARAAGDADDDPAALAELWLQIAQLDYRQQEYSEALRLLNYVPQDAQATQKLAVLDLKSRILMAEQQYGEAAALLGAALANERANELANENRNIRREHPDDWRIPYLRYNYAIALIRSGNKAEGAAQMQRLGQANRGKPALRERANLVLGYDLLRRGSDAKPLFQRLPLSSPYSNRGMLGLGWTELTLGGDGAAGADRALDVWHPLSKRNPLDPAVQEALVAVPYATELLGEFDNAASEYREAIASYEQAYVELRQEAEALRNGRLRDGIQNDNSSVIPRTANIEDLYTSHLFQAHIRNYRDLKLLQQTLTDRSGSPKLQQQLAKTADAQIGLAERELAAAVDTQIAALEQYEISARLGLLRSYSRDKNAATPRTTPERAAQQP